jgi:hypothetical protein
MCHENWRRAKGKLRNFDPRSTAFASATNFFLLSLSSFFTLSKRYEHSKVKYKGSVKCDVKESIQQQPYKITSKKE